MKRLVALADTHLSGEIPERLTSVLEGADLVLHAGDFDTVEAFRAFSRLGRMKAVAGNSDPPELRQLLPERVELKVDVVRIGLVHIASHTRDPVGAAMLAREMDVGVLIFGHIHRPYVKEAGQRLLISPGSPTLPRMSPPTVAEIEIEDGKVKGRIVPVGEPVCNYLRFADSLGRKGHPPTTG